MDCLALSNCEVKEAKYFTGLQVIVKKSTDGHDFSKSLKFLMVHFLWSWYLLTIENILALPEYHPGSVRVKGFAEEETEVKRKGYNEAGLLYCRRNWLHEECDNTGLLNVDRCYKLCGLLLHTYKRKYGFRLSNIDAMNVRQCSVSIDVDNWHLHKWRTAVGLWKCFSATVSEKEWW